MISRTVELSTQLQCTPNEAWARVTTPLLLHHIATPLIRFIPMKGQAFPETWHGAEYRAWMLLFGFIPVGWQAIVISFPEPQGGTRFVRDNGYGPLIRRWDHWVEIAPSDQQDGHTRYTDRVTIEAGILTWLIAAFAKMFYSHRQRRWRRLARSGFATLSG